jgi:hypothetical protein
MKLAVIIPTENIRQYLEEHGINCTYTTIHRIIWMNMAVVIPRPQKRVIWMKMAVTVARPQHKTLT